MTQTQPGPRHATPAPWAPPAPPVPGPRWVDAPRQGVRHEAPAGFGFPPPVWQAAPGPVEAPGRPRWGWIVLGIVAVLAALGLVGTLIAANQPMTVQGSVTVYGMNSVAMPGTSCSNTYLTGKPVSIFGADGSLVGTSSITGYGTAVNEWSTYSYGYADACRYSFTVSDVPAGEKSYRVTLGTDVSNSVGFTEEQLARGANITWGH